MYKTKGQALLSVILLLTIAAIFISGLTSTWRAEIKRHSDARNAISSFYLAQAGLERAKIELANNWNWNGVSPAVSLGEGNYSINVNIVSPIVKNVVATGRVKNCEKILSLNVVQTGTAPAIIYIQGPGSWKEL